MFFVKFEIRLYVTIIWYYGLLSETNMLDFLVAVL